MSTKTPKGYFNITVKPKHWWWPWSRRKARKLEQFIAWATDEDKVYEETKRRMLNLALYGNEEGKQ